MTQTLTPPRPASTAVPVTLTINGQKVIGHTGQTVYQAATDAGIFVPVLCHHPALPSHGACRICVVEIEKQRTLQPSCTFPVAEGLVVQTESPRVVEARKFVLEMLFSERQHYCMYCTASGNEHGSDCELQRLGYRYGLDCWKYAPNYTRRWPVDATRTHFMMDHARCILCRRCVRACHELVSNHTLGLQQRGTRTMICADDSVPFGESTCVSCGTCLQICPTGALYDRRSAYLGHECDTQRTRTTCMQCAVGCGIETLTRDGSLIRIEGLWDAPNHGVLCEQGRFSVLDEIPAQRIKQPLIRANGQMRQVSWDEALRAAADGLSKARTVAGLVTPRVTNESLIAFSRLFRDIFKSSQVGLLSGRTPPLGIGAAATLEGIAKSDGIIVIAGDPLKNQKVLGYMVRKALDHGARLIVASGEETGLDHLADLCIRLDVDGSAQTKTIWDSHKRIFHLRSDRLAQVKKEIDSLRSPVVLYGAGLDQELYAALRSLPAKTSFLPLVEGANAVGAARLGFSLRAVQGDALYVLAGDEQPDGRTLPEAQFTIVQASYRNAWTDAADIVLPAKAWFEKTGHLTNIEGRRLPLTRSIEAPREIVSDWATVFMLSVKLGQPLACVTVSDATAAL